jgi:hypothetical protein
MSQQPILDVFGLEGFLQERIGLKLDHAERQVIARSPVGVGLS